MSVPLAIVDLIFFYIQQLGVILGVGAEAVMLVYYLLAIRDHKIDTKETHFMVAIRRIISVSIACIVLSGLGITIIHSLYSQTSIIFQPAYIFKWYLITLVLLAAVLNRIIVPSRGLLEGFVGSSWFAMLLVHMYAPAISWGMLGVWYAAWVLAFMVLWSSVVYAVGGSEALIPQRASSPTPAKEAKPIVVPQPEPIVPPAPTVTPVTKQPYYAPVPPPPKMAEIPTTPVVQPTRAAKPQQIVDPSELSLKDEEFPYQTSVVDRTEVLHPHLTGESETQKVLPAPPNPNAAQPLPSTKGTKSSEMYSNLPALRVMPQTPQELEAQQRGPYG